jgi:LytS/YehU family sensor histidine kinase
VRIPAFLVAAYVGACLGETATYVLAWDDLPAADLPAVLVRAARWVPVGVAIALGIALHHRAALLAARTHETEMRRLDLERQAVELELQTLKSQIEPHFLFNTLATVRRLYQSDRARGRDTLVNFIRYLRSAVPGMRERHTTVGHEIDLVAAYLGVLQARMDERLRYRIDVPARLREALLPPLSVATLVENAVKHGISRLPEGGDLLVRATEAGRRMHLSVTDTGPGFTSAEGGGTGLANLRARLRAIYGADASLHLAPNSPHGVVATLDVPAAAATDER